MTTVESLPVSKVSGLRKVLTYLSAPLVYWYSRLRPNRPRLTLPKEFQPIMEIGTIGVQLAQFKNVAPESLQISQAMDTVVANQASHDTLRWVQACLNAHQSGPKAFRIVVFQWLFNLGDLELQDQGPFLEHLHSTLD